MRTTLAVVLGLARGARAFNGYHADFRSFGESLSPTKHLGNIGGIAEHGLTLTAWSRNTDVSPGFLGIPISVASSSGDNLINLFAAAGYGYFMLQGVDFVEEGRQTKEEARQWRHYTATYDGQTMSFYIDGRRVSSFPKDSYKLRLWNTTDTPELNLGQVCYHSSGSTSGRVCKDDTTFFGQIDDVALFVGSLSEAEIAERWNASLTDRVARGLGKSLA